MKKVNMSAAVDYDYESAYLAVVIADGEMDCIECDTLEEAEEEIRQQYTDTMVYTTSEWKADSDGMLMPPTEEQKKQWNDMIDTVSCYIVEWDDDADDWNTGEAWILEPEELEEIGWIKK